MPWVAVERVAEHRAGAARSCGQQPPPPAAASRPAALYPGTQGVTGAVYPRAIEGRIAMSDHDAFARILASLYAAMLDETRWPATSVLIDEACGPDRQWPHARRGPERRTSVPSSSGSTIGGTAATTWSASTSPPTIPSTNESRASGNCRPGAWCTSPTCYTAEGVEDLTDLQRDTAPGRYAERPERPAARAGRLPHRLGPERSPSTRRAGGRRGSR